MTSGLRLCCIINRNQISGAWASSKEGTGGPEESTLRTREEAVRRKEEETSDQRRHFGSEASCPHFQPSARRGIGKRWQDSPQWWVSVQSATWNKLPGCLLPPGLCFAHLQQGAVCTVGELPIPREELWFQLVIAWRPTACSLCTWTSLAS